MVYGAGRECRYSGIEGYRWHLGVTRGCWGCWGHQECRGCQGCIGGWQGM